MTVVARGASSQLCLLGGGEVVKLFHAAVSDEMIEREGDAARLASALGMPAVPPLRAVTIDGARGLVYPYLEGGTLMNAIRRRPWTSRRGMEALARLQARLHDSPPARGLRKLNDVLRTDIIHGPAPVALKDAALARMDAMPDGGTLLHGDLHIDNIMLSNGELKVIDWSKAAIGVPTADAVRTEMLMRFGDGPSDPITAWWREWAARQWRAAYLKERRIEAEELILWRALVSVAWLRARKPIRQRAFLRYMNGALRSVGLPPFDPQEG